MKKLFFPAIAVLLLFGSCASIPPEFYSSMEKEKEAIALLNKRHIQTVQELTENWYNERISRIEFIKQQEIGKIKVTVKDPVTNADKVMLKYVESQKIDEQYREAIDLATKIKDSLLQGYSDGDNWVKLVKIHSINFDMTSSLKDLNAAQRKMYSDLVGKNIPFPTDFVNDKTKKLLSTNK